MKTHGSIFVCLSLSLVLGCAGTDGPAAAGVAPAETSDPSALEGEAAVDPGAPDEVLFQEALALYNAPNPTAAEPRFLEIVANYPDSPRRDNAYYLAARCQYQLQRFQDCISSMEGLRAAYPETVFLAPSYYFSGRSDFRLGNIESAQRAFELVVATDPADTYADNAAYYAGRCDFEAGDLAAAEVQLSSFEQAYPDSSYLDNALYYLGRTRFAARSYAEAVLPLGRVIETVDSHYVDNALYHLVRVAVSAGDCTAATARHSELVAGYPQSVFLNSTNDALVAGGC